MEGLFSDTTHAEVREASAWGGLHAEATPRRVVGGYEFHHPAVLRNVPPPTVTFARPLRWWSLDRHRRRALVMRLRDQLQEEILRLGHRTDSLSART
jgi:hypothetical protein